MCVHTNTHHIRGETTIPTHVRLESHTHTQRAVTSMVLIPSYIQSPTPTHIRLESCTHTHIHTTCSYLNGSVFFLYPVLSSWQAHAQIRLAVTSMALFLSYIQSSPADRHTHRHDSQLPQWLCFLLISNPLQRTGTRTDTTRSYLNGSVSFLYPILSSWNSSQFAS